uniref:Uncharacterized protein n=1 Tax=Gasterosteus aculeatus aculeatus TaxID=481459 RepID=A0AAQ4PUC8_GASAC
MEVLSSAMGPERVLPNSEDKLGGSKRPADGAMLPAWSGGGEEEEEGEVGSEMELDGEEEENDGGYYYQPLNQEPEGEERAVGQEDTPPSTEQLQQRIQVSCVYTSIYYHSITHQCFNKASTLYYRDPCFRETPDDPPWDGQTAMDLQMNNVKYV